MNLPAAPSGWSHNTLIEKHFNKELEHTTTWTSKIFAYLLLLQWLIILFITIWFTPFTWTGESNRTHPHVWNALYLGAIVVSLPLWLAIKHPTRKITKHCVAIAQMGMGSILIHTLGGRIEAHFHVFGSLAFLSFYRDWRVIVTGSLFVMNDHILRGFFWPISIYGMPSVSVWRWMEHTTWVIFEDIFLIVGIRHSLKDVWTNSTRQIELEQTNGRIELTIEERTRELRESESRFRIFVEHSTDAIFLHDSTGRVIDVNQLACENLQFSREELIGKRIDEFDAFYTPEQIASTLQKLLQTNELTTIDSRHRRKDGSVFPIEIRARHFELDEKVYFLAAVRNVSERKAAEEALRQSEERYRQLFESNPHPMWVYADDDQSILAVNRSAVQQYGYSRQEFLQMRTSDFEVDPPSEVAISNNLPQQKSRLRRHKISTGEVRQFEVATNPLQYGDRVASILMAVDVTEKKLLEEQLKQAQKMESIGQLAAGVAHEINTPMQFVSDNIEFLSNCLKITTEVISVYEDQLNMGAKTWEERRAEVERVYKESKYQRLRGMIENAIDDCREGVERIVTIVRAMRQLSHPGTDNFQRADLNKLIHGACVLTRNNWKYVAEMKLDLEQNLPEIDCRPAELSQVLINLIVNASDAVADAIDESKKQKGSIVISSIRDEDQVVLKVADTGCGIPKEIAHRIFDPFFTTKPIGKGTGQGLAITYDAVVNKHDGSIRIDSNPDRGEKTIFVIRLPIVQKRRSKLKFKDQIKEPEIYETSDLIV